MAIQVTAFAGQNWVITPLALAVNEAKPTSVSDQKFILVLTGVAIINLQGNKPNDWRRETVHIFPDMQAPLEFAVNKHSIPKPAGQINFVLSLEQWAPFAALSSIFEKTTGGVDAGFAVDVWRPSPFLTGADTSGKPLKNGFGGIAVDVAVRNNKASLHRVSYHITLVGKINFVFDVIL